jgi:hypothetical protein
MAYLDECCAAVRRWLSLLGITDRVKVEIRKLEPNVCASTWTNPDYLEALIAFNDPAVCGPYDLDEVAAHEVFHIPMGGFQTQAGTRERSEEERVVERFSRAFVALWRGTPFANRVALAPKLRAFIGESRKARHRLAAKRREGMHQATVDLILKVGAAAEREDVPEDVRALLRELVAATVTGEAPPASAPGGEPPAAEADPKPEDGAAPPAMRAGLSEKARKALEAADKDAEEAAKLAKERVALETEATRQALFSSAPDVFGLGREKRRAIYASASIDEIKRYIAGQREERGAQSSNDGKARKATDPIGNEPPAGDMKTPAKNPGGFVLKGGN